ncbi:MAG: lytic murein transglycosylase B [Pseudomonadales bacterium]|jgi:membrane-bound lytic murein transglycosylase B
MRFSKVAVFLFASFLFLLLPFKAVAKLSYETHPQALALVDEMVEQHGFDRKALLKLFAETEFQDSIVALMDKPAEAKPWKDYRPIFVTNKRAKAGKEFMAAHQETLARAEAQFGVPAEIIVAIIGVETRYGVHAGNTRVMDALATLAFDYPRRSEFFRKELVAYLLLTRQEQLNPLELKGSYAGAMGYGQFMPSSFLEYAIDFDGDGRKDIWHNPVDAIGSVANYFARHGWKTGEPVVSRASFDGNAESLEWVRGRSGLKPSYTVAELATAGLHTKEELVPQQPATPIRLSGAYGREYWVGLHNFYVITRYNHSALYAMSVYQLSQKIAN